ncbi:MAG: FAD-binding oxidoreductase [Actinomycetes bacterium]
MTTESTSRPRDVDASSLRGLCGGAVHLSGDPGYDPARMPWNVAVDQRPAAVAFPTSPAEVADVIRAARQAGLRMTAQGTGHNAAPLGSLADVVLLRTSDMTGTTIDPVSRRARVSAGSLWLEAVEAAAQHGLAGLHGSSPDVGVVGYSLGGGIGWYARSLGMQTNQITAVELVTADGSFVRADANHEADLFWGLRGGGGNFGVVTALEFALHPIETAFAGMLTWDWSHAAQVLHRWSTWAPEAPDSVTTAFRLLQLPPIPEIPEPFRGRRLVMVNGVILEGDAAAERILAPLRELGPDMDTFSRVPASSLVRLHMDPEGPTPAVTDSSMLGSLPAEGVEAFLTACGSGSGSSLLMAELRQLGGALGRRDPQAGALPHLDGRFLVFGAAIAATPEMGAKGLADAEGLVSAMAPWANGRQYLNFAERQVDVSAGYPPESWARLTAIRSAVDPDGIFLANHRVRASD